MYITYYLIKVAASLLLTALERLQVNGRPATVLHYYRRVPDGSAPVVNNL
jgi:hypothetical protein